MMQLLKLMQEALLDTDFMVKLTSLLVARNLLIWCSVKPLFSFRR